MLSSVSYFPPCKHAIVKSSGPLIHYTVEVEVEVEADAIHPRHLLHLGVFCGSHYDRFAEVACGWPSEIWLTAVTVPVGACGWPSEMVEMGIALPVGA